MTTTKEPPPRRRPNPNPPPQPRGGTDWVTVLKLVVLAQFLLLLLYKMVTAVAG